MVQRTTNPGHRSFGDYAHVPVSPDFLGPGGFAAFLRAVGERPSAGHTLDRIDPRQGYTPGNLRWADKRTQEANKIRACTFGRTRAEWAEIAGVSLRTFQKRIERGWSDDRLYPVELRR